MPSVVLVSSPKGGVGKSSIARNLLVSAAQAGRSIIGLDLDAQRTTTTWAKRRENVRKVMPTLPAVPVIFHPLEEWRSGLREAKAAASDLVVVDTPPSVELNVSAIAAVAAIADLTLVPSLPSQDDLDSVGPWMKQLRESQRRAAFVLNRANARTRSYTSMRTKMLGIGAVCPTEVPTLEEIMMASSKGLGVPDMTKARSAETFQGLWHFVCLEIGL